MNKNEIIALLQEYKTNEARLKLAQIERKAKERELKEKYESKYNVSITPAYIEGGRSNLVNSKVENAVIKSDEEITRIKQKIKELKQEIDIYSEKIEIVDALLHPCDDLEKDIIKARYIDNIKSDQIGLTIYWKHKQQTRSGKTIDTIIDKILEKMEKI